MLVAQVPCHCEVTSRWSTDQPYLQLRRAILRRLSEQKAHIVECLGYQLVVLHKVKWSTSAEGHASASHEAPAIWRVCLLCPVDKQTH